MRVYLNDTPRLQVEGLRTYEEQDQERLGFLLFDAYLGTIDQEEETVEDAHAEIGKTVNGEYGVFLPSTSFVVERNNTLHSAALVTRFRNRPFLAFSFTRPGSKNQGLARACITSAMAALFANGEDQLHLVVTKENVPAFHLYRTLGFEIERDV